MSLNNLPLHRCRHSSVKNGKPQKTLKKYFFKFFLFFFVVVVLAAFIGKYNTELCLKENICWIAIQYSGRWLFKAVLLNPNPQDLNACWFSLCTCNQEVVYTWDARWRQLPAINYLAGWREAVLCVLKTKVANGFTKEIGMLEYPFEVVYNAYF